jgi:hypothetical protein
LLYEELKRGEVSEGQDAKSRAFTLRCKVCNEESVYGVKEILEFEGPPRIRTSERKRASTVRASARSGSLLISSTRISL